MSCVVIILAALLVAVGCGLAFRRVWARWCMIPLMAAAALVCFDGVLCGGFCGTLPFLVLSLVGLGIAVYTSMFIALSLWMIYRD